MAARKRFPEDPSGAWLPIAGRRAGSPRQVQVGRWDPVAGRPAGSPRKVQQGHWRPVWGRPVGSPAYRTSRGKRSYRGVEAHYEWSEHPELTYWSTGRYKLGRTRISATEARQIVQGGLVDLGPEAHFEWSELPALTYWSGGRYKLGAERIHPVEARQITRRSIVDRGPEAHWRWHDEPPRIEYFLGPRYTINGRFAEVDQVQWAMAEQLGRRAAERLEWEVLAIDPPTLDLAVDSEDVQAEVGTANIPLEEIEKLYDDLGRESDDVTEERDVPLQRVPEDAEEEARQAWSIFETEVADETAFGRWIGRAKGLPVLISYYLVAHRVVYVEQDVVLWGEVIRTRYAPFGRGESYVELRERVKDMREKSDEEVTFVAAGIKVLFKETLG